jgi:hypothetical protein
MSSNLASCINKVERFLEDGGKINPSDDFVSEQWTLDQLGNYRIHVSRRDGKTKYTQIDCDFRGNGPVSFRDGPNMHLAIITPWKDPWCGLNPDEVIVMACHDDWPKAYRLFLADDIEIRRRSSLLRLMAM